MLLLQYGFHNICCEENSIDMEQSDSGIHLTEHPDEIYANKFWEVFSTLENAAPKVKKTAATQSWLIP